MKQNGNKVIYFAGYKNTWDLFKQDEVEEAPVRALHPEDELEERDGSLAVLPLSGGRPQIAVQRERARGVVDARDTLFARLASGYERPHRFVDGERGRGRPGRGNGSRQTRELPQHPSRVPRISFTERSAAAITESAPP